MAKRSRSRKSPRTQSRRASGRLGLTQPPPTSYSSIRCNTTLRGTLVTRISDHHLFTGLFSVNNLLTGYPKLASVFKEVKILKVKVWLVTTLPSSASGIISLLVAPSALAYSSDDFADFSCSPGVMTRKSFQTLHGVYYPTQPSERNWFPVGSQEKAFAVQICAVNIPELPALNPPPLTSPDLVSADPKLKRADVQIVWDAHLMFRGRYSQSKPPKLESTVRRIGARFK